MPYCGKCGAELPEGARYCPSCGTPVGEVVREEFSVSADNLVKKVKELIHEGNVRRIIIKDEEGKTLLDMPVTVGVVGGHPGSLACGSWGNRGLGYEMHHSCREKRIA